jgi:FkbM family methyltransferase
MIYCVEPSNGLVDTLAKNLQGMPAIIINRAISNDTDENKQLIGPHNIYGNIGDTYKTITFKKLIEDYNISHIDFLKIDCEGGEYEVFTEENRDYILNNVKNVAGEWHFLNEGTVEVFKNFRDLYLKGYEYKVFDRWDNDVSEKILDDQYLIEYERFHRETLTAQFMVYISYDAPVITDTPAFTFYNNPRPALWVVDNFYDDPYAVREFALRQEYNQGGLGRGYIGKRSCEQFLFPGLKEAFRKITGIPITRWEEHGMNGRFQSTISGEPNVYHSDEQTWAGAIYLTPDAPYNAGTSLIAHKPTRIRHSSHPEAYKMWSDPNTYDIHLDPSPWERIDVAANVFNRLVIWNAHCPHAAGEYFGETLDTSRLIHLFFFD